MRVEGRCQAVDQMEVIFSPFLLRNAGFLLPFFQAHGCPGFRVHLASVKSPNPVLKTGSFSAPQDCQERRRGARLFSYWHEQPLEAQDCAHLTRHLI